MLTEMRHWQRRVETLCLKNLLASGVFKREAELSLKGLRKTSLASPCCVEALRSGRPAKRELQSSRRDRIKAAANVSAVSTVRKERILLILRIWNYKTLHNRSTYVSSERHSSRIHQDSVTAFIYIHHHPYTGGVAGMRECQHRH